MPYIIKEVIPDGDHLWTVMESPCLLTDNNDKLLTTTIDMVRDAYGETEILALPELQPDRAVAANFNLTAIQKAVRAGLPDPDSEGDKPTQLTNYRSETCEMLAKGAIQRAYGVLFLTAPQRGKTNANMPVLGFDNWGVAKEGTRWALVIVQVKGTHDPTSPPKVAEDLCDECIRAVSKTDEICRTLTTLAMNLGDGPVREAVLHMLEAMGNDRLPLLYLVPAIIRGGNSSSVKTDFDTLRAASSAFRTAKARGLSLSVGVDLAAFGRLVMSRARAA